MAGLTAGAMAREFDIMYDMITSLEAPGYNNQEKSVFLSKAQENIIKQRYKPRGNKYGDGFEQTEKRRVDLSELIQNVLLVTGPDVQAYTASYNLPNGRFWEMPNDFMWSISESADIVLGATNSRYTCTGTPYTLTNVRVKPKTHDEYHADLHNPYAKPYYGLVWRMDYQREDYTSAITGANKTRHELITDGSYGVSKYRVRYIRRPDDIIPVTSGDTTAGPTAVDCRLDPSIHREIVTEAVRIATSVTKPEEMEIKEFEVLKSE